MATDKRFAAQWNEFAKMIPADAPSVQVQEMRRAFYAGGVSLFSVLMSGLTSEEEPTEQDFLSIDALKSEFDDFARALAEGRA